jgi:hypothetical protein
MCSATDTVRRELTCQAMLGIATNNPSVVELHKERKIKSQSTLHARLTLVNLEVCADTAAKGVCSGSMESIFIRRARPIAQFFSAGS